MPRVKKSSTEIRKVIKSLEPSKRELGEKILNQLEFMEQTMAEMQARVKEDGAIIETTNGNGFTVKSEHPASKAYSTMVGRYNAMIKTVDDLLPKGDTKSDELLEFIGGGRK